MINKRELSLLTALLVFGTLITINIFYKNNELVFSKAKTDIDMKLIIEELYNTRSNVFVSGNLSTLKPLFDLSQKQGHWALEHEVRRVKYFKNWSKDRNIKLINLESSVRIKRIYKRGNILKFSLEESYKFDYIYPNDTKPVVNSSGVGIRHILSLINKNQKWLIYNDWYTDCFEDAMGAYSGAITTESAITPNIGKTAFNQTNLHNAKYGYNRQKAIEYADKYCGAAWGSGNNFKYNKKYNDYNGLGGDCTNYVSQVLGDKEGGSLKQSASWCSGSNSWANVNGLKDYIIYSGKGYIISVGTFEELTKKHPNYPNGVIAKLCLGDLICYVKKGDPDHFSVVTGMDSHGYPLINSHTTDRYHVPWDLGWGNKNIKFILIHING